MSADAPAAEIGDALAVLPPGSLPGFDQGAAVDASFDLVELAVAELCRRNPRVLRGLRRIAGDDDIDRYLCRALLREAGSFLGLALLVASPGLAEYERVVVERRWPNGPDFAFLARVARTHRPAFPPPVADAIERMSFEAEEGPRALLAVRSLANAARQLLTLWRDCLGLIRPTVRQLPGRPLLIRSYGEDWGLDRGGQPRLRNLDFVVDGETVLPEEVGVWLEAGVPADRRRRLEERGYGVIGRDDIAVGPLSFVRRFLPSLAGATTLFARLAAAERWWPEPVRRLLFESLLWGEIARSARPRVLLALNDIHPSGLARTFALRRAGCLTVEYEFSSHWLTDEKTWIPDYVYGFTVLDAMVSWGPLHSDHFRNHRGVIREFWEVGCLWSEHARIVRENDQIGDRYRETLRRVHGVELGQFDYEVGVFDTSTASFFGPHDMVAFYAGVSVLAARMPHVLFLCKPKRPLPALFAQVGDGASVEAALTAAANVVMLDEYFETAAVVGLSDLSVNACFTSPAVESIGAGRPAVYYDPTDLFPNSFFRSIPGLVATTVDNLCELVEKLLALDEVELTADLGARFAALEGHFDGLAITRLRGRLRAVLDTAT
ncbi:MAG TPA: hypothetical protein VFM96_00965 [Gaiellaceae bacterium]|nr:hypothetical protein [Gaiellaceae bacterium]